MDDAATQIPAPTHDPEPLSAEQQQLIAAARRRARKVGRAAGVASFDAWTTAVFAGLALMFAAFSLALGDFSGLLLFVGGGMAVVAYNAFRGADGLRRYDISAPRRLALNQVLFAAIIIVYCICRITGPSLVEQHPELVDPQVQAMLGDIGGLSDTLSLVIYGAVICGSILVQGGTALYYITRAGHVRTFREQTPSWVLELLGGIVSDAGAARAGAVVPSPSQEPGHVRPIQPQQVQPGCGGPVSRARSTWPVAPLQHRAVAAGGGRARTAGGD